jgi:hypothetical protein
LREKIVVQYRRVIAEYMVTLRPAPGKRDRPMEWTGSSWDDGRKGCSNEPNEQADDRSIRGACSNGLWIYEGDVEKSHSDLTSGSYAGPEATMMAAAKNSEDPKDACELTEAEQTKAEELGKNSDYVRTFVDWGDAHDDKEWVSDTAPRARWADSIDENSLEEQDKGADRRREEREKYHAKMLKLLEARGNIPEDRARVEAMIEGDRLMEGGWSSTADFKDYISALAPECCMCFKIGYKSRDMICLEINVPKPNRTSSYGEGKWETGVVTEECKVWRDVCKECYCKTCNLDPSAVTRNKWEQMTAENRNKMSVVGIQRADKNAEAGAQLFKSYYTKNHVEIDQMMKYLLESYAKMRHWHDGIWMERVCQEGSVLTRKRCSTPV